MISLTTFKYQWDNKTDNITKLSDFDSFEKVLYTLAKKSLKSKKEATLISPAIYEPDTTRANKNVCYWGGWAAVDVDDFIIPENTLECLKEELDKRVFGYRYICYSTASSSKDLFKFRLVFPLSNTVYADQLKHFWFALNNELGNLGDKQTKDISRMYYIPGTYENAYNFIFSCDGNSINPGWLMDKYPYNENVGETFLDRLPDAWREQVLNYRKETLNNHEIYWTDYRDCPFWPKHLASEYQTISDTGWYRKMYQIMVATAGNAVKRKYPITPKQIAELCRQFDNDTGQWYISRPLEHEADKALEYVYKNM